MTNLQKTIGGLLAAILVFGGVGYGLYTATAKVAQEPTVAPETTAEEPTPAPTPTYQSIDMLSLPYFFQPAQITVTQGTTFQINFTNAGNHSFVIPELGVDVSLNETYQSVLVTANTVGTFDFYSTVNTDRTRGMQGKITVVPAQ